MKSAVRVRFAPSPTGPLHMGGVRTALYNYLFAKKNKGVFILRIEDTDRTRFVPQAEEYIIESLRWCGIEPDEGIGFGDGDFGPYRQSERTDLYRKYAAELVESGNAYYAFDSSEELDAKRTEAEKDGSKFQYDESSRMSMKNSLSMKQEEVDRYLEQGDYVIRFKMPANEEIVFEDIVRDTVTYNSNDLDDKILLKADGYPTYHMANVVDDHYMEISHVIRGEEWLPSTPLHVMLYGAFNWDMPVFAHLPLILKPSGKGKLSKRDGAKLGFPVFPLDWKDPKNGELSSGYKEAGFFPEAFMNIMVLLGWHPTDDKEVFSIDQLIEEFALERVVKSGARFDFDKAKWLNQQHLMNSDNNSLAESLRQILLEKDKEFDLKYCEKVVAMMKERVFFLKDIPSEASYLFGDIQSYDEKMVRKKFKAENESLYHEFTEDLKSLSNFDANSIESAVKSFMERKQIGFGAILPVIRLCVSGTVQGPSVFDIMELLAKDEVISRMSKGIEYFNQNLVN